MGPAPERLALTIVAALLPSLFAWWLYWPTHDGGLLADELMLAGYVLEPGGAGLRLSWSRVGEDFTGPWAFGYGTYYRPLVTLAMVLGHWLTGGSESALHVTSIAFFVVAVFWVARLCGVLFGPVAAFVGGLLFAVHPACHEPVCWPCTCADFLVLAAAAWACASFARHLQGRRGRHLLWTHVAIVLALLSKENALLLAVWLLLLDFAVRGRGVAWRVRLRPHAGFAVLWLLYLTWRWVVLGTVMDGTNIPASADLALWFATQSEKLRACLAPYGARLAANAPYSMGALSVWAFVGAVISRRPRRWIAVALAWSLVALLPVQWHEVTPNLSKGRYVIAVLIGPLLVIAAVMANDESPRWFRGIGAALLLLVTFDFTASVRTIQSAYRESWLEMKSVRQQVSELAREASEAAPLVMLAGVRFRHEIPFLPPTLAYALVERPLAQADHPFVSLGMLLEQGVGPHLLEAEAGPWRAMWRHGSTLCFWFPFEGPGRLMEVPAVQSTPRVLLHPTASGFSVVGGSGSPWSIGAIEVVADRPFESGRLTWFSGGGYQGTATLGAARRTSDGWVGVADLAEDIAFLSLGTLSGITGFDVTIAAEHEVRVVALRVVAPAEPIPLARPLRGTQLALADLGPRLSQAGLPANADPASMSAVLMNRALAFRVSIAPDRATVVPAIVRANLAELDRGRATDRVYYYLECRGDGRTQRSEVDWFVRLAGQ